MRYDIFLSTGPLLAALLALGGCSGSTTGTGGSGTGGQTQTTTSASSSSSTSTCNSCDAVVTMGLPHPSLCNDVSAGLYENLQDCACAGGPCGSACDAEVCGNVPASAACLSCMAASCASTWDPCQADTTSH